MAAFYKSQLSLAQQQRPDQQPQRNLSSRLPTRSAAPISSSSNATRPAPSKLLKKNPADNVRQPRSQSASTTTRIAASKSSGNGTLRRENTSGPEPSQPNHSPHPTIARPPRFDAAYTPTPSLVSGSSASTLDSPRSALLRRKPSSIGRPTLRALTELPSKQEKAPISRSMASNLDDQYSETVLGIALPPVAAAMGQSEEARSSPHLQYGQELPHQLLTEDLPPPTPMYALSASPSTRCSESPGRFSHTSSPTSMSSHSPGVVFPSKFGPRARQSSPTRARPLVMRRKTDESPSTISRPGLPSVRESRTSSSSGSTVRVTDDGRRQQRANNDASLSAASPLVRELSPNTSATAAPADRSPGITVQTRISVQSTREAPVYPPPELAHLAQAQSPPRAPQRPVRPSREGTPDLSGAQQPLAVIQSNLTSLPSARHKRQSSSTSSRANAIGSPFSTTQANHSRKQSFTTSPSPGMGSSFSPISTNVSTTRGTTPDQQSDAEKRSQSATSSVPPSPSKGSRFGFFTRRKTEPTAPPKSKEKRKGPMAGTGHEGYGKYGVGRGRNGSATSLGGSFGRSPSTDSVSSSSAARPATTRKGSFGNKNEPEMDSFFKDRLAPKVLRGEGSVGTNSEGARSETSLDSVRERPPIGSRQSSNVSSVAEIVPSAVVDRNRPTLLPSAMSNTNRGMSPYRAQTASKHGRSDSSDSNLSVQFSTRPGNMLPPGMQAPDSTYNSVGDLSEGKEGNWLKPKKKEQESQIKAPRKWNFFQRAQTAPKPEPSPEPSVEHLPAAVSVPAHSRSFAHYAIQDAEESHHVDMEELERIMQEANRTGGSQQSSRPGSIQGDIYAGKKHPESILLPSPPVFQRPFAQTSRPASPKVLLRRNDEPPEPENADVQPDPLLPTREPIPLSIPETQTDDSSYVLQDAVPLAVDPTPNLPPQPRPSRLPQVGRIPQVVSQRNRPQKRPHQSFSRPFAPMQPSPAVPASQVPQEIPPMPFTRAWQESSHANPPVPPFTQDPLPQAPPFSSPVTTPDERSHTAPEFFAFPPRKYSELSYTSSSGASFPISTAIIPVAGAPPQEDEVWKEYDDLIDDVLSSPEPPKTKRRESVAPRPVMVPVEQQVEVGQQTETGPVEMPSAQAEQDFTSKAYRVSSNTATSSAQSVHLRRSRLLAAFQALATPSTPGSMSEMFSEDGGRGYSVVDPHTGRLSFPSVGRFSASSARPISARSSLPASIGKDSSITPEKDIAPQPTIPEAAPRVNVDGQRTGPLYRDSRLIEMAENHSDGFVSMANLRFGALMTSKWLSFGRVLFSPAHLELKNPAEDRVLILDGLGKDWSYYCALTYPNASIYYLGPAPSPISPSNSAGGVPSPPPNYRHIHHTHPTAPFPFPRGFFAGVVLRFPIAAPDAVHRATISECKRVLRPGGYLEVSVLDLDMANMGNRARRAVRELKMRMQAQDPDVGLSPMSDAVVRLLGRRGFEGLKSCVVGVPVAGRVPKSRDLDADVRAAAAAAGMPTGNDRRDTALNFSELLTGTGDGDGDNITKMVARVGRWWYSRCYESLVLPQGDLSQSIWADETLLRECEKRQTSFRLLVCYAQKPAITRRRTVSV